MPICVSYVNYIMRGKTLPKAILIGIDVGTTAVKAAAFWLNGQSLAVARRSVSVLRESVGFSEIDMEEIWLAVVGCLSEITNNIEVNSISGIGVCGQGDGLWLLDADLKPVRKAILWNDTRASKYVTDWSSDGTNDRISRYCRTSNWPGTSGSALRWVQDNEPKRFAKIKHILYAKDWIVFRLTGKLGTDFSDATIPFFDLEKGHYAVQVFAELGLKNMNYALPTPSKSTSSAGKLNAQLGIPSIPVARGSLDLAAVMTGVGLNAPGDMCLILGTTAVFSFISPPDSFTKPPLAATIHHPFSKNWIRAFTPQTGASALDWFASLHTESLKGNDLGEIATKISQAAKDIPPGANGVLFLPFLTGERAPFVAPEATGSFHGIGINTSSAELARAVMEGTGFSLRHCLQASGAPKPERVVLTGGGARNTLWCQIVADILGVTILANASEDHGLWGAALLGGAAAGLCDPTSNNRDEDFDNYAPNQSFHKVYTDKFQIYLKAIEASREIWTAMRRPI